MVLFLQAFLQLILQQPQRPMDTITWEFSLPACEACIMKQLSIMDVFSRPRDKVIVNYYIGDESLLQAMRGTYFTPERLGQNLKFERLATTAEWKGNGFTLNSPETEEIVSLFFRSGMYNSMRAKALLKMYRAANG